MPLSPRAPLRRVLFSSEAYEILKEAIIKGEFAPGEQIKDTELAASMGLSRTPVREALSRLTDAGLVESKPGVYTRVTPLSRRDVTAALKVLQVLDELAVREAGPLLTKRHLRRMRQTNQRFGAAVQRQAVDEALAADDAFHGVLIEVADNPVLTKMIDDIRPQIHRILYRKFSNLLGRQDTSEHHDHLIDLFAEGQIDAAAASSAEHWRRLGGLVNELFDADMLEKSPASGG
ncbi:GntR family transcriptional regulator [Phytoactinopolyspora limicola]|uniref:GntR family transcriptional regulator n=1 Tax=Phytoactinopolyspora limicola TaxID=2715536 RepID=UPI0014082CE9|nr:GntR family transcriptional regulator [Phytoactinopolyspora limicola]